MGMSQAEDEIMDDYEERVRLRNARDGVIAASLHHAAGRLHREISEPTAHDDAQDELESDMLDDALMAYAVARGWIDDAS